jgi:GT2 family glycosyltransferase
MSCLVVIPAYGRRELTDQVIEDLLAPSPDSANETIDMTVIDNQGSYTNEFGRVEIVQPGRNLRWIGSANYALRRARDEDYACCVIANNDLRTTRGIIHDLCNVLLHMPTAGLVGPVYNDYWPHQRASDIPASVDQYVARPVVRRVPFCDGTFLCLRTAMVKEVGVFDETTFSWHGYGSDIDLALRARSHGWSSVVTENCYVDHIRRGTMSSYEDGDEYKAMREYMDGLSSKWGPDWRSRVGLEGPLVDPQWDS